MNALVPLVVAAPLAAGIGLALYRVVSRVRAGVVVAVGAVVSAAVTAGCATLLNRSRLGPVVYWFGGWTPRGGVVPGIAFVADLPAAGLSALASLLVTAVFVHMLRQSHDEVALLASLLLVFLGSMVGFVLAGDLFDLFVFLELSSIAAYALTAFRTEGRGPLQGSINFAIVSSVGSVLLLLGIALVYRRTGDLNMAAAGRDLSRGGVDGLAIAAFALVLGGLFVKGAVVPFHFWHADAHAVAPGPVCALFSAVMTQLGVYAVARVYSSVFAPTWGTHAHDIRTVLVTAGVATAILGAVMSSAQLHVKRLLAFSAISHAGVMMVGVGLLDAAGAGGSAIYLVGHALVKAPLFLVAGLLVLRFGTASERELHGLARGLVAPGIVFGVAALGLAGAPPFGTFAGASLIDEAAQGAGLGWLMYVVVGTTSLTGGAVLRIAARTFLGWGDLPPVPSGEGEEAEAEAEEQGEPDEGARDRALPLLTPAAILVVLGALIGLLPGVVDGSLDAGASITDHSRYAQAVLGEAVGAVAGPSVPYPTPRQIGMAVAGVAGAFLVAASGLWHRRLPDRVLAVSQQLGRPLGVIRRAHSGHPGDYVVWTVIGTTLVGAALTYIGR